MDILVSAIIGDLISRSASFVIRKYFQQQQQHGIPKILQRLQSVLLRIDIIVEEAEARHITNQGMLRQLKMLRQAMYRGHYVLDTFTLQTALNKAERGEEVSDSSYALSKSSPAKRLRFSHAGNGSSNREALLFGTNSNILEELQRMVDTLEDNVAGMKEFLFFLELYPRILRQPYGTYLILDNCMFGRQTERQRVLNFLLCPIVTPELAVLPIIGPRRVGKSTLVEYVCRDESVRDRFSMILFFPEGSFNDGVIDLRGNKNKVRHQNCASQNRLLILVEIAEDICEETWRRLKSSATCMAPCGGSKIIITSRSDKIVNLGTTEALRLDYLSQEAYWHFFKSLAFGSTSPDEQPKLATMAMEIASEHRQCFCFTSAHIIAGILRDNFNARFWRTILECVRAVKQVNLLMFDQHPNLRWREDGPVYYWRLEKSNRYFLVCNNHQLGPSEEIPKITVRDILLGGTLPHGEFEALLWRSRIPPYYNYMISCKMQAPQLTVGREKRTHQEEEHLI